MRMDVPQSKMKKAAWSDGCKNSSLFDIVKNAETTTDKDGNVIEGLTGREKIFYEDQKGKRRHLLSQEIDEEYENEQLAIQQAIMEADAERQAELDFINEDTDEVVQVKTARRDQRHEKRPVKVDKNVQVSVKTPTEPVRLVRNATQKILDTISGVSTVVGISVAKARKATREVCKRKYGDIYELQPPDQAGEPRKKKPRSAEDYKAYSYVLPSEKSVNNFKHKKAITEEIIAAKALHSKKV